MKLLAILAAISMTILISCHVGTATELPKNLPISASSQPSPLYGNGQRLEDVAVWCAIAVRCSVDRYIDKLGVCALYVIQNRNVRIERYNKNEICEGEKNGIRKDYGIASMAKSLTSTLLGRALSKTYNLRTKAQIQAFLRREVGSFLPLRDRMALVSGYSAVSLEDMLSMRSDIEWRENGHPSWLSDTVAFDQQVRIPPRKQSLIGFASHYKRTRYRVQRFNYSALDSAMAIAVTRSLQKTTPLHQFERGIWGAMGAAHAATWNVDNLGDPIGSCCFRARIDDLARFGDFVLHKGEDGGIPSAWFELATAPTEGRFSGLEGESDLADPSCKLGYGYYWWLREGRADYFAYGRFGQFIHIYPKENVVIVQASDWAGVSVDNHAKCVALKSHDAIVEEIQKREMGRR